MNRKEALRMLGLDEGATQADIKAAYKETVQILHPDKFEGNKKLQNRATEQFKNLQEAYDFLVSELGAKTKRSSYSKATSRTSTGTSSSSAAKGEKGSSEKKYASEYESVREIEARITGIAAAKTQLVTQRDVAYDDRRNGFIMAGAGVLIALIFGRKPGVLMILAGIAATAAVWGIVQVISSVRTIGVLSEHIKDLELEKKQLLEELDART